MNRLVSLDEWNVKGVADTLGVGFEEEEGFAQSEKSGMAIDSADFLFDFVESLFRFIGFFEKVPKSAEDFLS